METVPYLLHPLGNAKLLFDLEDTIEPLLGESKDYFAETPEIEEEWNQHYR